MSLIYLVISVFIIIVALGWTGPVQWLETLLLADPNRWILGVVGAVMFVVSLTLFVTSLRTKPSKIESVHENSLGLIRITLPALENLVLTAAQSVPGVRDVKPLIKTRANGLIIYLKVQVSTDLVIPAVSEELQKKVKEYVAKMTGTTVHEIHVSVTKISWETRSRVE